MNIFNARGVRYLIVGGYAVMRYTEPRFTKDLDVWVSSDATNARLTFQALAEFGAPLSGINADDFSQPDLIYQLGVPPLRIDILTTVSGVDFEAAWQGATEGDFGEMPVRFIGREDLIANKRAVGRLADLLDCERLEEANPRGPGDIP